MKLKYLIALTGFTLFHPSLIQASELSQVAWQLSQDNLGDILSLSSNNEQYKEMVQLLREIKFDVKKDEVIEKRTLVNYFPRFVDAESYGTMSLRFDPNYQKVIIKAASSISPTGEIKQIKPYKAEILNTGSYNTFSSQKEVALAIPGLKEGSIAVLKYEVVTNRSQMEHSWAEELFTQQNYPIQTYNLNVAWNEDSPIYWSENSHKIDCKKTDKSLDCRGNDISAFKDDSQVLWRDEISRITLSSMNSWRDVADLAKKMMTAASRNQSGLDELLLELTAGTQDTSEKIERILAFVSRDIRYVSHSEYGHAFTPHDIEETIRNRYGDCKDKSTLLFSLLKKLKLKPELVLVATKRSRPEQVLMPSMTIFNHVITCFEFDSTRYCVDPTDNQTPWRYTPAWIQGKLSLPLTQDSRLETIQHSPYRWKMNTTTQIVFDELGGQKETQTRNYIGEYAAIIRSNLFELNSNDRAEKLTDEYHEIVSSIGKPTFYIENINSMADSVAVHSETILDPFLKIGEPLAYEEGDAWMKNELSELKMFNEFYPAFFQGVRVKSTVKYDTNDFWEITDLPPTLELKHPLGSLIRQVNLKSPTELYIETVLEVKAGIVNPEDRKYFNTMLRIYSEQSLIKFYGKISKSIKQVDKAIP
ncbi:DUF3857 domain-containing transglutaminase family protein [Vibrio caribbeanicus]|uniref:DUF3857 domain-containing protein n=1 Tax=Vibrio caribbeanicus ATCC BAA-2122 TaxID=796620 RepID=E3BQA8_9VIBR|nr:DUF3857 domain-containing protein [Vibrio caribbeanicus]EFP94732.1 hypothetical protein VIBC2010_13446 [Vibrio caribbeanicus ATCC BAA-2122]